MKFIKKMCLETGYNPFSTFNSILNSFWLLGAAYLADPIRGIPLFITGIVLFLLFIVRNCIKMKKIKYIIPITLIQLPYSLLIFFILVYKIYKMFQGNYQKANSISKINWAEKSWSGNRAYDDNRAMQLGYSNVQDAIEHGIAYDGTEIF